jgi:hypothetical protein
VRPLSSLFYRARDRLRRAYEALPERRRRIVKASPALPVLALAALVFSWSRHASLRVVNTLADPLSLSIDARPAVMLPPVSAETPEAGVLFSLSPGEHHLVTRQADGSLVDELDVSLPANSTYLFAPALTDQCFWIEHTAYGQARPTRAPLKLLPREQRIWSMPDDVDAWFFPTPPSSALDRRSSGGTRTAVRQARCGFDPWH